MTLPAFDRTPPSDFGAEQCVLGAMMLSPLATTEGLALLRGDEFYRPAHITIFETIRQLSRDRQPSDAVTVNAALMASGEIARIGGSTYLHDLIQCVPTAANLSYYAAIVKDRAILRNVAYAGTRSVQHAYAPDGDSGAEVAERAVKDMAAVRDAGVLEEDIATLTAAEFVAVGDSDPRWLIPDMMERADRMIVTGDEGQGKSLLILQIGVTLAAGKQPFNGGRFDPGTVLMVDCENDPHRTRRRLRHLLGCAEESGTPVRESNLWVEQPSRAGIDLSTVAGRRWILRRVEQIRPDLLVIGPLYKLHRGNINDEELAREITATLDDVRDAGDCAVLTEAHSPHANGSLSRPTRPAGASLFLRWPEFGYCLRRNEEKQSQPQPMNRLTDLVPWRGPREERQWPQQMFAGSRWPWDAW